jgi:cobalt-zinc-cadmium efflux system outer membrane protein
MLHYLIRERSARCGSPLNRRASLVILLLFQLLATQARGQTERLTLSGAVREAIQFNQQLRVSRYDVQAAQADRTTAGLRPNPTLTVNADILPSQGFGPADKNYGVSLNFPFELGGKRDARVNASEAAIDATEKLTADQVRQTIAATRAAYFDFVGTAEKARAAEENLALLDSLVSLSKIRVADNDIAAVELTRSEVEQEKFGLQVVRAREEHRAALVQLLTLMGRPRNAISPPIAPDSSAIQMVHDAMRGETLPLDSLLALAEEARPDIQALRAQEKSADANLALQKSLAKIDLNVSLDLLRSQGITFYGSTVSVPLPFYNQNQGEIEKANVKLEQAHVQTEAALAQLRAEVTNAWFDAETKREALKTLEQDVLQKASSVRNAIEYSYKRGGTSLVDYLDAARTYNELQQDYVDALQSYAKSLVTLNLVTGKDFYYDRS